MSELKLYDYPRSGNCYKVRLLLSMLNLDYARIDTDVLKGETLTAEFKQINPRGQVPVLLDDDLIVWDSMAILVYLTRRYADRDWMPTDPVAEAGVLQWLAVSENELLYGLARARATLVLGRPFDLALCQQDGKAGLAVMEGRLANDEWLVGRNATLADIACYPYVSLAEEGGVSLQPYPAVRGWLERFAGLPGWEPMLP
ncbi:MAG: glutathione S-transferase family protein [Candidatus Thiodiazotropha sp.]